MEKYKTSWQCDAEKISISGNTITFTYGDGKTVSAEYTYAGYQPKRNDEGEIRSVRYQFETTSADAPKYVQFNDHGHEPGEACLLYTSGSRRQRYHHHAGLPRNARYGQLR